MNSQTTHSLTNNNDPTPGAPNEPAAPATNPHASPNTSQAKPGENAGATAVAERRAKPRTAPPRVDHLPPFKVLLHNDDHNPFEDVIETIVELTPHPRPMAIQLTHEADRAGVALLLVTHRERAELYREQFASKRLTVTIEPAV